MNTDSKFQGSKKGLLFTVVTFLLLSGLLSFSLFYLASTHDISSHIYYLNGDKLRFLDSDIGESLLTILDTDLGGIERSPGKVRISFSSLPAASSEKDYASNISNYESFLEGNFEAVTNNRIELNLGSGLEIMPWNISINPAGAKIYIYTENASAIRAITMEIQVNKDIVNISANGIPPDQGGSNPQIHIIIKDRNGAEIINANPRLTVEGGWIFYADFDDDSGIDVIFGRYSERDGTLRIEADDLNATIGETGFEYDPQGQTYISLPGKYLIGSGNLQKNQSAFLFEGGGGA